MKKSLLILSGLIAAGCGLANAQKLQTGYVTAPESSQLHTYINAWNGGSGTITIDGKVWEDEEFFTSRVKPRKRVTRYTGDVYNIGADADKRVMWWVPIGDPGYWAIPNSTFDSEVFSCWSYIDHYGNFAGPYGWADGAFADVAHKNGVAVTGQASVPNSGIPDGWKTCLTAMGSVNATNAGKFLYYHGVDGLAYNSEWTSTSSLVSNLTNLHKNLMTYMADKNPIFENIWYDGTNESGGCSFDSFLSGKTEIFKYASMFSNYNWNSTSLSNVPSRAESSRGTGKRASFYYYAGCNMQGGEPKSYSGAYNRISTTNVSLGYWGAHSRNMFWEGRGAGGVNDLARQQYYLNQCETFFSNYERNPAVRLSIIDNVAHRPIEGWPGISRFRNAATAIDHVISQESFYSFFNLGNGTFFNWKGERVSNNAWYSIGIQDYMPTWRFWVAPTFMGSNVTKGSQGLQCNFTWDDAYVGGSSLKISGSATTEYIHLFKAAIVPGANNKVVVRYRLLNGEADINMVLSSGNNPTIIDQTTVGDKKISGVRLEGILTVDESSDVADNSFNIEDNGRWVTKVFNLSSVQAKKFTSAEGGIGVIALEVKNAKNLELLLGEVGIYPGTKGGTEESLIKNSTTPNAPTLTTTKMLANNREGVDAKLIWTMDGGAGRRAGTPVYNSDVNVSMFKMYAQEEGGEETFMGVTTSWAGIVFKCPNTGNNKRIRFGVRAVSADTRSESAITWSAYQSKPTYSVVETVLLSKPILKPNESFSFYYADPLHESSTWELVDANGKTWVTATGISVDVPDGLPNEGGYTLYINRGKSNARELGYFVQVSSESKGALPKIYTVTRDGVDIEETSEEVSVRLTDRSVLAYTGRASDGNASRAMQLCGDYFGAKVGDLGIGSLQSFSVSGWVKFNEIPSMGWHFMNVSDRTTAWPNNEWGWCWNDGTSEGRYESRFRGGSSGTPGEVHYSFPDIQFQAGIWTHFAWICEYTTSPQQGFRHQMYINGVKQKGTVKWFQSGNSGTTKTSNGVTYNGVDADTYVWGQNFAIGNAEYIYFGGPKHEEAAIDGIVDDFQIWNKAMTQEDVNAAMVGFPSGYPTGMLAEWNFEADANSDNSFSSLGAKAGVKAASFQAIGDQKGSTIHYMKTATTVGCPFLSGTGMPIETKATWADNYRRTSFLTASSRAATEGEAGQATVSFEQPGDHQITLTLENAYGSEAFNFPVYHVEDPAGIGDIDADGEGLEAYTEGNVLFIDFGSDGAYNVQVYNTSGMLVANEVLNAVAGQSAQVTLGNAGVYLVKVLKDGKVLRTIKVLAK